ncbi:MAG: glycosyltransferase family 9 protein [Phycisphaerae bacterium]|nr:glycosyltransferase family 9 protein [Phycisphaerae bacterium]
MKASAPTVPPGRVLIIKPSSLGDVVTALPVLRGLRRAFPDAHLAWLLGDVFAPLLDGDPDLDEVILFHRKRLGRCWRSLSAARDLRRLIRTLRAGKFDWALDLQGLFRSGYFARRSRAGVRAGFADAREGARLFYTHRVGPEAPHTVDRNIALAAALGVEASRDDMTLHVPDAAAEFSERFARERGLADQAFLVAVPPTRWPSKRYPVRHWRTVAAGLTDNAPLVLLGAPGDERLCGAIADGLSGVINAAGQTSIPQMVALIAAAAGVLCSDSAAKFVAPAVGTDAVVLIGPTRVDETGPVGSGRAIVADVPCRGCRKRRCGHGTCMELIDPRDVIAAGRDMLASA